MTNDARRTSQLGIATTLSANDRVVVLTNPATSAQTQTISVYNFANSIANSIPIANATSLGVFKVGPGLAMASNGVLSAPLTIYGPYSNDSNASANGVAVGSLYYNVTGSVQIRLV